MRAPFLSAPANYEANTNASFTSSPPPFPTTTFKQGHYVPGLAREIVRGNARARRRGDHASMINLKGALVGNAWTDPEIDNEGALDFWYTHALVGRDARAGIKRACNFR